MGKAVPQDVRRKRRERSRQAFMRHELAPHFEALMWKIIERIQEQEKLRAINEQRAKDIANGGTVL
jgi:hypothetical protein